MSTLHVQSRPFPGAPPPEPRDLAGAASSALAAARRSLDDGPLPEHPAGCRCSVWCRDEWTYADKAIGACEACGEPCRSTDPEGRLRHPTCGAA
jgi:hypothetical protein